jgi:hypothetical protein
VRDIRPGLLIAQEIAARLDIRTLPSLPTEGRMHRLAVVAGIITAFLCFAPVAQSDTLVSDDGDPNVPFVIDPSSDPTDPVETEQIDLAGAGRPRCVHPENACHEDH